MIVALRALVAAIVILLASAVVRLANRLAKFGLVTEGRILGFGIGFQLARLAKRIAPPEARHLFNDVDQIVKRNLS